MENLKDKKLVVASAASNCSQYITAVFNNVNKVAKHFKETKWIIVESDSTDNTHTLLKDIHQQINCEVYSFGNLKQKIWSRTERIAKARNHYLDIIEKNYIDYDLLLVIDINPTNIEPFDDESILSNFKITEEWDMICANQSYLYYDLWALRHPIWMPDDCWLQYKYRPKFMSEIDAHRIFIKSKFIHIDQNQPLIPVQSAFGGTAFIKIKSIQGARHDAFHSHIKEEVCEWVPFCKSLNKGINKIYINPKFINQKTPNQHTV